ncbi:chemotaxis protein CheW [Thermohalobacter berrensis]|uniref:Chemotaxis protein CheW n=1 Tax=Thermohalobacter berrensis TaxID=99594 RepID=A0A419TAG3_9FIRM|nr:chemotaxis protein CheW [Thermohalobacter berrensis]RKD34458.1 chemotaxis protein CheW [Thermohalobacter berrensis]
MSNINSAQYVLFKLNDEYYGIDISKVKTIEKIQNFTRVPNAPNYVKGVINLRGEVVPVIDLRKRFNLPNKNDYSNSRIIIVTVNDIDVGLIVDSSSEVLQLTAENLDNPPHVEGNVTEDFIKHIGKDGERLIMILDIEKVLGIKTNIEES